MDISSQFNELLTANGFVQLVVLSLLEIVLGIDNLIFISLTASKILDKRQRSKARMLGLFLALIITGRNVILYFMVSKCARTIVLLGKS
jgi:predicted tellurium resistance membrane protein TerC